VPVSNTLRDDSDDSIISTEIDSSSDVWEAQVGDRLFVYYDVYVFTTAAFMICHGVSYCGGPLDLLKELKRVLGPFFC
jgi:hypothetical protein